MDRLRTHPLPRLRAANPAISPADFPKGAAARAAAGYKGALQPRPPPGTAAVAVESHVTRYAVCDNPVSRGGKSGVRRIPGCESAYLPLCCIIPAVHRCYHYEGKHSARSKEDADCVFTYCAVAAESEVYAC
ncbi:hypothetical protein V495_07943, partial [Pseudogymnoascus sp. VKM F-4514 (FW-929)]